MEDKPLNYIFGVVFVILFIVSIVFGGFWGFLFPGIPLLFVIFACLTGEDMSA